MAIPSCDDAWVQQAQRLPRSTGNRHQVET